MFSTPVRISDYPARIDHSKRGLILGSCFAEEIGGRLQAAKFPVTLNPHGILFNPASIGTAFKDMSEKKTCSKDDLVWHDGLWHSMNHHGAFSAPDIETVLKKINTPVENTFDYSIITLGTAWVYQYKGRIVANCHKIPAGEFSRKRLSVEQCVQSLDPIALTGKPIIMTISPVRHLKDGLSENNLSKSILRVAAAELAEKYANVLYFPSYEIVTDELRDYRYYADDMTHPSKVAVGYVWQKFVDAFFSDETRKLITEISKLRTAFDHRPLHPASGEYQKFRTLTIETAKRIESLHPDIDFSDELARF